MPNGTSERSALIEHCGVGGSVRKGTLYPIMTPGSLKSVRSALPPTFSVRDKGVRLLNICSKEPAGSISTKFSC